MTEKTEMAETPEIELDDQLIDDTEELETEAETEQESEAEEVELEGEEEAEAEETEEESEEEEVLTIDGEEVAPASEDNQAPNWVKDLRKDNRKLKKRLKELESQQAPEEEEIVLGDKPKLEDFDYDEEAFLEATEKFLEKKRAVEAKKKAAQEEQERQQQEWQDRLDNYDNRKASFIEKRPDYEDAEDKVRGELDEVTQNMIVMAPEPERLVYALGKQPEKLAALKEAKSPLEKMFQLGVISTSIKTQTRQKPERKPQQQIKSGSIKTVSQAEHRLKELSTQRPTAAVITEMTGLRRKIRNAKKGK